MVDIKKLVTPPSLGAMRARTKRSRRTARPDELRAIVEAVWNRLDEIDAYTNAAETVLTESPWSVPRRQHRDLTRQNYLLGKASENVSSAIEGH